jgi:hypothetical protein
VFVTLQKTTRGRKNTTQIKRVLNRFVHMCAQKFVMANETTGFGGLKFFS